MLWQTMLCLEIATQINVKQKNEEFKWKKKNKHDTLLSDGFMWPINTIVPDVCVLKGKNSSSKCVND